MVRVRYSFGSRHTGNIENIKKQRGKYPDVMRKVVEISDIILEVLDARFVEETRNLEIETDIKKKGKKLIYIFNKVDLVDLKKVELPKDLRPFVSVSTKTKQGARDLRDKIKIEAKKVKLDEKRTKVHVGIIGYPNVGKSSLINLIARRGAAKISKQAGYTRGMQKIRFAENILILDTPGVIPGSCYSTDSKTFAKDAKLGARTYSNVKDPEDIVTYLMTAPVPKDENNLTEEEKKLIREAEINAKKIEKFYGIDAKGDSEVLIEELGKKKGFLGKGGKIDVDRAARIVLRDWQEGKIR